MNNGLVYGSRVRLPGNALQDRERITNTGGGPNGKKGMGFRAVRDAQFNGDQQCE